MVTLIIAVSIHVDCTYPKQEVCIVWILHFQVTCLIYITHRKPIPHFLHKKTHMEVFQWLHCFSGCKRSPSTGGYSPSVGLGSFRVKPGSLYTPPPPKINKSLEKGPFEKDISSSNHHFSRGILFLDDSLKKKKQNKSLGSYLDPPDFV